VIGARTQLDQGFDHFRDLDSPGIELKQVDQKQAGEMRRVEREQRIGADITRSGIEFIRANRNRPFLLWLHYFDAHMPYSAPGAYNGRIPQSPYHAEVAYVDSQVGLLTRALRQFGLKERTLVVITSDHGEGLEEHGEVTHSFFVYDSTMRIPLIFWGPADLLQNWRVKSLVRAVDITPTILDWLDMPSLKDVQGTSLMPLIVGDTGDLRLTGYGESIELLTTFGGGLLRFVREGSWKYIHQLKPTLYDLESDPGEQLNVADRHPELTGRLEARLRALIEAAPEAPQDSVRTVSAEMRAELIALGYVGANAPANFGSELESLKRSIDPVSKAEDIELFSAARGRLAQAEYEKAFNHFKDLWERNPRSAPILAGLIRTSAILNRNEATIELIASAAELAPSNRALFIDLAGMALRADRPRRPSRYSSTLSNSTPVSRYCAVLSPSYCARRGVKRSDMMCSWRASSNVQIFSRSATTSRGCSPPALTIGRATACARSSWRRLWSPNHRAMTLASWTRSLLHTPKRVTSSRPRAFRHELWNDSRLSGQTKQRWACIANT